jgi:hypothetical protein
MNAEGFLFKSLTIVLLLFMILLSAYFFSIVSKIFFISVLFAWIITTFNFSLGVISVKISLNKSQNSFFKIILGGVTVRLFLMLITVYISLKFLDISQNSFIFSILFFYILYLMIEVIYLYMKKI